MSITEEQKQDFAKSADALAKICDHMPINFFNGLIYSDGKPLAAEEALNTLSAMETRMRRLSK